MKALPSILLGVMLLASLVGISYAQGSGDVNACVNLKPNDSNYYSLGCAGAAHQNGNENQPPHRTCFDGKSGPDAVCCPATSLPSQSLEASEIQADCLG